MANSNLLQARYILAIFVLSGSIMQYYPIPSGLAPYVESVWSFESPAQLPEHEQAIVIPSGKSVLLWNYQGTYAHVMGGQTFHHPLYDLHLVGPHNKTIALRGPEPVSSIGITFKPYGYYAIAGPSLPKLVNHIQSVSKLNQAGKAVLSNYTDDRSDSVHQLLTWVYERIRFNADKRIIHIVDAIDHHQGNIRIQAIFAGISGSQRYLNKLFKNQVGLTPKAYASIVRLQEMYSLYIRDQQTHNKDRLYDLYYDESHFLQHFRKVFESKPKQFMRSPNLLGNAFNKKR